MNVQGYQCFQCPYGLCVQCKCPFSSVPYVQGHCFHCSPCLQGRLILVMMISTIQNDHDPRKGIWVVPGISHETPVLMIMTSNGRAVG